MATRKKPLNVGDLDDRAEEIASRRVSARAKPGEDDEDDDRVVPDPETRRVSIEEDEDDEDDEEGRPSRSERNAERSRARSRLHRENEDLRRRLDELERRPPPPVVVQAPPAAPPKPPGEDEFEREIRAIEAESTALEVRQRQLTGRKDAAGNVVGATPDEIAALQKEWWGLERRKTAVMVRAEMRQQGGGQPQGTTPEQVNQALLMSEYPDIFTPQNGQPSSALRWGHARHQQLLAEGAPNTLDTARKALKEARERFGHGQRSRPAPPPERKARFESVSRGGGGSDSEDERPRSVMLTAKQQAIAEERYPNLKPEEAHKKWAKAVLLKKRERA